MARKASGNFDSNQYINDYIKEKYDRINLTVPAGQKAVIEARAKAKGKSTNEYIRGLINEDLERQATE